MEGSCTTDVAGVARGVREGRADQLWQRWRDARCGVQVSPAHSPTAGFRRATLPELIESLARCRFPAAVALHHAAPERRSRHAARGTLRLDMRFGAVL